MLYLAVLGLLIAACDQIIKLLIVSKASVLPITLEGVVSIVLVKNEGAAFSILQGARPFFLIFTPIAMAGIFFLARRKIITGRMGITSLAMIFGGALGNYIDRLWLGYVIDYIRPEFVDFAIFNLADCSLVLGCALFAVYVLFFDGRKSVNASADQDTDPG